MEIIILINNINTKEVIAVNLAYKEWLNIIFITFERNWLYNKVKYVNSYND